MEERIAARTPRKLAHACSEEGRVVANATDRMAMTRVCRTQMAVTIRAVR